MATYPTLVVERREAQAAVEIVVFIPLAMERVVPLVPNAMFVDHVLAPLRMVYL